jgi:hypothetical protein
MVHVQDQLDGFGVESHQPRDMLRWIVEDVVATQEAGVVVRDQGRFLLVRGGQAAGRALARLGVGYVQNEAGGRRGLAFAMASPRRLRLVTRQTVPV